MAAGYIIHLMEIDKMTKKAKIIAGVVGGVLVLGGIGNAVGDKNKKAETSLAVEGMVISSAENISTPTSTEISTNATSKPITNSSQQETSTTAVSVPTSAVSSTYSTISSTPVSVPASTVSSIYSSTIPVSVPATSQTSEPVSNPTPNPTPAPTQNSGYVFNTNTKKYHRKNCSQVKKIKPEHYATSVSDAEFKKYSPCKICKP